MRLNPLGWLMTILFATQLTVNATQKFREHYVPLTCMTRLTIVDFGKCTTKDQIWDCTASHLKFVEGCVSTKPVAQTPMIQTVQRPTSILTEDK